MIQLIKNVHVFRQGAWRLSEILIAGELRWYTKVVIKVSLLYNSLTLQRRILK